MRTSGSTQDKYFTNPLVSLLSRYARNESSKDARRISEENYNIEFNLIEEATKNLIEREFNESKVPTHFKIEPVDTNQSKLISKPKVYISYAWNDKDNPSREKVVQEIYESLLADGFDVRRDRENVAYSSSIRNFMEEIGRADCIIVAISSKYLTSENCMFEMHEIYRNSKSTRDGFYDKILPIRVESIALNDSKILKTYFEFWEEKEKGWEDLIKTLGTRISSEQQEQYRRVKAIAYELGDFLAFLNDINAKSKAELSEKNFEKIKSAIMLKAQS